MQNCIASPRTHSLGSNHLAFAPQLETEGGATVHRPRRHGRGARPAARKSEPELGHGLRRARIRRHAGLAKTEEEKGGRVRRGAVCHGLRTAEEDVADGRGSSGGR